MIQEAAAARYCNPSCGTLMFRWIWSTGRALFHSRPQKADHKVPVHPSYYSATVPGRRKAGEMKQKESLATKRCGAQGRRFHGIQDCLTSLPSTNVVLQQVWPVFYFKRRPFPPFFLLFEFTARLTDTFIFTTTQNLVLVQGLKGQKIRIVNYLVLLYQKT